MILLMIVYSRLNQLRLSRLGQSIQEVYDKGKKTVKCNKGARGKSEGFDLFEAQQAILTLMQIDVSLWFHC